MLCPEDTLLARLVSGGLAPSQVARIDEHADRCERCRGLLADLALARSGSRGRSNEGPQGAPPAPVTSPASVDVGRRYHVLELIGQGGMGRVYRAVDRVTGRSVALKRVLLLGPSDPSNRTLRSGVTTVSDSGVDDAEQRGLAALAGEFRVLAMLRHPNIVSVLDYGFDAGRKPYFTMELLSGARPLLPSAALAQRGAQLDMLVQILRALAYLHRHGVLHRDLKPSNILISADQSLKLVDFGLAVESGDARRDNAVGTVPYMAPELFRGEAASEASDLYAVGVIAYEMLVGHLPFRNARSTTELIAKIVFQEPDLAPIPPELRQVIGRALRKSPAERPQDAMTLLHELLAPVGARASEPPPSRDSHLVAARFTGRERELEQLRAALAEARLGRGSGWLVGGESGVGKSRLLEELRSHALIEGVLVMRGQAVAGGMAFHVFHHTFQVLALHVPLSDLELSVLGMVLPELGALLAREVQPPPPLDVSAARLRLLKVLRDLLQSYPQPALILLEDVQWADAESVALLAELGATLPSLPLLIAASYREDEAPKLPAALAAFTTLRVPRFDKGSVARLCTSMLGPAGGGSELVNLVLRESEGNAYFIVEAMRALAEESGSLADIGRGGLPERILAGGIEQVLERRLSRVPAEARALLRLAAVAGRQLDVKALSWLAPDLDALVQACMEAGVLEVHEQRYRYSHDKLRERVLHEVDAAQRPLLHARVAEAMKAAHGDSAAHAAAIAHHFQRAARPAEAAHHFAIAGEAALARGAPREAASAFEQATALHRHVAPPLLTEVRVWRGLAQAYSGLGQLAETDVALRRVFALTGSPLSTTKAGMLMAVGRQIAEQAARRAGLVRQAPEPVDTMERRLREERLSALSVQETYAWLGQPDMLVFCTFAGLNLEEALGSRDRSNFNAALAFLLSYTPLRWLCRYYLRRAAATMLPGTRAEIDYMRGQTLVRLSEGRWAEAIESARQAVDGALAQKDELTAMYCLVQLQAGVMARDDHAGLLEVARQIEALAVRTENPAYQVLALLSQGGALLRFNEIAAAAAAISRAREILPPDFGPIPEAVLNGLEASCAMMQGHGERALAHAHEAMRGIESATWAMRELNLALYEVLDVYLTLGDPRRCGREVRVAIGLLQKIAGQFPFEAAFPLLYGGRWAAALGRPAQAAAALRRCLRITERLGTRYTQGMARYALGCLAREEGAQRIIPEGAEPHLRAAAALFEALGAPREAGRAHAALSGRRFPAAASVRSVAG